MRSKLIPSTWAMYAGAALVFAGVLLVGTELVAQTAGNVHDNERFEIGDGVNPLVPGVANLLGDTLQPGPDWDDLFDANRRPKDVYDEFGAAGSNGVPDFLDTWGGPFRVRRDGGFVIDDVSAGSAVDGSVFDGSGLVGPGTVAAGFDLGNAYAYTTFDAAKNFTLYAGLERIAAASGSIVFEFNRKPFSVGAGGDILGQRTVGDLRVRAEFPGGVLGFIDLGRWEEIDPVAGVFDWLVVETLPINPEDPAEQCSATGTACVVCNGASVAGGAWVNYDSAGNPITDLPADSFMEFGINLTSLLGLHTYDNYYGTRYASIQISTYDDAATPAPKDYALGNFFRAAKLAK